MCPRCRSWAALTLSGTFWQPGSDGRRSHNNKRAAWHMRKRYHNWARLHVVVHHLQLTSCLLPLRSGLQPLLSFPGRFCTMLGAPVRGAVGHCCLSLRGIRISSLCCWLSVYMCVCCFCIVKANQYFKGNVSHLASWFSHYLKQKSATHYRSDGAEADPIKHRS